MSHLFQLGEGKVKKGDEMKIVLQLGVDTAITDTGMPGMLEPLNTALARDIAHTQPVRHQRQKKEQRTAVPKDVHQDATNTPAPLDSAHAKQTGRPLCCPPTVMPEGRQPCSRVDDDFEEEDPDAYDEVIRDRLLRANDDRGSYSLKRSAPVVSRQRDDPAPLTSEVLLSAHCDKHGVINGQKQNGGQQRHRRSSRQGTAADYEHLPAGQQSGQKVDEIPRCACFCVVVGGSLVVFCGCVR